MAPDRLSLPSGGRHALQARNGHRALSLALVRRRGRLPAAAAAARSSGMRLGPSRTRRRRRRRRRARRRRRRRCRGRRGRGRVRVAGGRTGSCGGGGRGRVLLGGRGGCGRGGVRRTVGVGGGVGRGRGGGGGGGEAGRSGGRFPAGEDGRADGGRRRARARGRGRGCRRRRRRRRRCRCRPCRRDGRGERARRLRRRGRRAPAVLERVAWRGRRRRRRRTVGVWVPFPESSRRRCGCWRARGARAPPTTAEAVEQAVGARARRGPLERGAVPGVRRCRGRQGLRGPTKAVRWVGGAWHRFLSWAGGEAPGGRGGGDLSERRTRAEGEGGEGGLEARGRVCGTGGFDLASERERQEEIVSPKPSFGTRKSHRRTSSPDQPVSPPSPSPSPPQLTAPSSTTPARPPWQDGRPQRPFERRREHGCRRPGGRAERARESHGREGR